MSDSSKPNKAPDSLPTGIEKSFDWSTANIIKLLRESVLLIVLAYLAFSFISGKIGISFGTKALTASEIISILLAFFAILLSAAFYYMSTQQSNLFYHNVHQFTKDTSEILGRLDEQVKNIGGKQTELRDTFEKNYTYNKQHGSLEKKEAKIAEELEKKEENLKEKEKNINETVDTLIEKIKFESEEEKKKLKSDLERERKEILALRSEMKEKSDVINIIQRVREHTKRIISSKFRDEITKRRPVMIFREILNESGPSQFRRDLVRLGYVEVNEDDVSITRNGVRFIREIIDEVVNQTTDI